MEQPDPTDATLQDAGSLDSAPILADSPEREPVREAGELAGADPLAIEDIVAAPGKPGASPQDPLGWRAVQLTPRQESPSAPEEAGPAEQEPATTPPAPPAAEAASTAAAMGRLVERWRGLATEMARRAARAGAAAGRLRAALPRGAPRARRRVARGATTGGAKLVVILVALNDLLLAATIAMLLLE